VELTNGLERTRDGASALHLNAVGSTPLTPVVGRYDAHPYPTGDYSRGGLVHCQAESGHPKHPLDNGISAARRFRGRLLRQRHMLSVPPHCGRGGSHNDLLPFAAAGMLGMVVGAIAFPVIACFLMQKKQK